MFGYYIDRKFNDKETKILDSKPDDYIWYMIVNATLFKDTRFFEIRDDIKIPNDNDGRVLIYEKGDVVYSKTLDQKDLDEEIKEIKKSCSYLADLFEDHIDAYIAHTANCKRDMVKECDDINCTIHLKSSDKNNGEEIISKLENKIKNNEKFDTEDSVDHILLPFIGSDDLKSFNKKYSHYMAFFES